MKILAVADEESKYFYDYYTPGKLKEYDLIISAGDLSREYLEFLVTMAGCPLLYICGNHDGTLEERPPEGCTCIDGNVFVYKGIRIAGLGGSRKYREGPFQYTEEQMKRRMSRLWLQILRKKGIDILVTHAPPEGIHDLETQAHRGFACFLTLMDRFHPSFLLHGHVHQNYGRNLPRVTEYGQTKIINVCNYYVIEYEIQQNSGRK